MYLLFCQLGWKVLLTKKEGDRAFCLLYILY